jgi:glutathione S-transferase
MSRVLYQFPLSHYCEKARWVLDYKSLPYRVYNQLPGPHAWLNRRRSGSPTVPVLVDHGHAISGSHAIAVHLERLDDRARLLPRSAASRALLDEIVHRFDHIVGPAVRRYVYGLITPKVGLFRDTFFRGYGPVARTLSVAMALPVSKAIAGMYDVHAPSNRDSPDLMRAAADQIEARLDDGSRYLLDDELSLADITVASLLGPVTGPPGSPWTFELDVPEFRALRSEFRARPIGQYIAAQYATRFQRSDAPRGPGSAGD